MNCTEYRESLREVVEQGLDLSSDLVSHLTECEDCRDFLDMVLAAEMSDQRPCPDPIDLMAYVSGRLGGIDALQVAGHLTGCAVCAQNVQGALFARAELLAAMGIHVWNPSDVESPAQVNAERRRKVAFRSGGGAATAKAAERGPASGSDRDGRGESQSADRAATAADLDTAVADRIHAYRRLYPAEGSDAAMDGGAVVVRDARGHTVDGSRVSVSIERRPRFGETGLFTAEFRLAGLPSGRPGRLWFCIRLDGSRQLRIGPARLSPSGQPQGSLAAVFRAPGFQVGEPAAILPPAEYWLEWEK